MTSVRFLDYIIVITLNCSGFNIRLHRSTMIELKKEQIKFQSFYSKSIQFGESYLCKVDKTDVYNKTNGM